MREMFEAYLERVERDPRHLPLRLFPLITTRPGSRTVVLDPFVSFGRPIVTGAGVATQIIFQRVDACEDIGDLAEDYGVDEDAIYDALVYEMAA